MQEVADARRKTVPQVCHAAFCDVADNGHMCPGRHKPGQLCCFPVLACAVLLVLS